jgi:hypothetical protein
VRVLSKVTVNGQPRTCTMQIKPGVDMAKHVRDFVQRHNIADSSGVEVQPQFLPFHSAKRRIGKIQQFMQVASRDIETGVDNDDWVLVACVQLFGVEEERGRLCAVDKRTFSNNVTFVRAADLGPVIAFGNIDERYDAVFTCRFKYDLQ